MFNVHKKDFLNSFVKSGTITVTYYCTYFLTSKHVCAAYWVGYMNVWMADYRFRGIKGKSLVICRKTFISDFLPNNRHTHQMDVYRGVLLKWEFFIKMRVAESQQSFDIEESCFSKNILFLAKNDFLFYYLKLWIPLIPLIQGFRTFSQCKAQRWYDHFLNFNAKLVKAYCFCAALISNV